MQHDLDAIKQEHPLSEIVRAEQGQPRRVGDKLFWPCPFHDESTPSFMIDKDERYHCFGCGESGDLFDYFEKVYRMSLQETVAHFGGEAITPEIALERSVERAKVQKERLDNEIKAAEVALAELRTAKAWERYHVSLLENPDSQDLWIAQGLPFEWQIDYNLGFATDTMFWGGESLTIPVFTPFEKEPVNIRHRLIHPGERGKYLPETRGLPSSFYWARPKLGATEQLFIVEGEKKAMVLFRYLYEAGLDNVQVIGIMGAKGSVKPELVPQLANTNRIYYIPDPDVTREKIWQTIKTVGKQTTLIEVPDKIDDMLIAGMLDGRMVCDMTHNGVTVNP